MPAKKTSTKTSPRPKASPKAEAIIQDETKRDFIVLAASSVAAAGAVSAAWPFIDTMNPAADVLALSTIEVDLSDIEPGQSVTAMWQGKPVFIRRRTKKEITEARDVDTKTLPDPEKDNARVKEGKDEWLVVLGICTHLGCVPLGNKGNYDGWFCPCHGSHYDTSGRIRKGPAPKNLPVPPYTFLKDNLIKIG